MPPRVEDDFDYSELSGSLFASERWSGEERPANDLLGNYTRAQRDIMRVDAVLAGQRPAVVSIARFEHASLGVSNRDDEGNVWNVGRGFDLRDLHRIELEEEPTLRLLGIHVDGLRARYPREDVEVHCRSDHLSSLRSWRSRDWFYGPSGPRQTPMLGIYNRYQRRHDIIRDEYISRGHDIIRDEYTSRGWSIVTGPSLIEVALAQWGRPSEAEQYERIVVDGHPRLTEYHTAKSVISWA